MRFPGKTVIVTGSGQGIGRAISRAFAAEGAIVILAEVDIAAGLENEEYINCHGGKAFFIPTDIARENEVEHLMEQTMVKTGRIDVLINNAGIGHHGDILEDPVAIWDQVVGVNLRGTYLCCKYAAPFLIQERGHSIINIASTRALMSEPGSEAYAASKGGIVSLTHALALSLGQYGVRVNTISPGWIEVGDWKKSALAKTPHHSESDQNQHPAGRVGTPKDIAEACLYLAHDSAGFVTGTNLVIDGGMTKKMIYVE